MKSVVAAKQEQSTRDRIVACARLEIEEFGILGLRLDGVSRRANISIPLIYRYFGGRDGLLAAALGDWYQEWTDFYQSMVEDWLKNADSISLEDFAKLSPKPKQRQFKKAREFRLQVLATAVENGELRARVSAITSSSFDWTRSVVKRGRELLPYEDRHFDERIFTQLLFNLMFVFSDLVPQATMSDEEYAEFLVRLIRSNSRSHLPG